METIEDLRELEYVLQDYPLVYVRYSAGPETDADHASRDYEADVELPGLPVTVLTPEPWWPRPPIDWVARRVCKYLDLAVSEPGRRPWLLVGQVIGYGPDHEPLLVDVKPLGWLSERVVEQARQHYHEAFDVGRDSRG